MYISKGYSPFSQTENSSALGGGVFLGERVFCFMCGKGLRERAMVWWCAAWVGERRSDDGQERGEKKEPTIDC
jgi:hypothetical protein